jgi:hypothetical protein
MLCVLEYGSSDTKAKFPDHTTIDVPFSGSLRPIQKDVVNISRKLITALGQNDCPDVGRKNCLDYISPTLWE